ncbi:MAG: hypothetical protein C4531_18345 [Desulfurivibrio sp.]|nr:MAG: hypothetical protein C4531_18345 [Desulfurivibrio sp.]
MKQMTQSSAGSAKEKIGPGACSARITRTKPAALFNKTKKEKRSAMADKCPECLGIAETSARNCMKCGSSGEVIIRSHLHPHPAGHALLTKGSP